MPAIATPVSGLGFGRVPESNSGVLFSGSHSRSGERCGPWGEDRRKALRILVISDAWHPQINGVVTTLTNTRRALENSGHGRDHHARPVSNLAVSGLPGGGPGLLVRPSPQTPDRSLSAGCDSHRDRGAGRLRRPTLLPRERLRVYDLIPQPFPRILEAPRRHSLERELDLSALVPLPQPQDHGRNGLARARTGVQGFSQVVRWSRGVDTELFRPWENVSR